MTIAEFINKIGFKVNREDVETVNKSFQEIQNNANASINGIMGMAKRLFGLLGLGLSLRQLNAIAEEFDGIGDRLSYAVGEAGDFEQISKDILNRANESRMAYGQFVQKVTSLKQANSEVFPIEDAAKFVEYTTKLGKAAGYSDGEISTMGMSIQRIISAGKAGSGDISRMLRRTPALVEQLAKSYDTNVEGLKKLADEGKLTAESIKEAIFKSTEDIDKAFANLNFGISDALGIIRNEFGFWVDDMNKTFNIAQSVAKLTVAGFQKLMTALNKVKDAFVFLSDKIGGTNNVLKLCVVVLGGIWAAMNAEKILKFLNTIKGFLKPSNLGLLKVVAIITLLFMLIEDFIGFMQGRDSVIGYAFEKAGIDADEMRKKILHVAENVKKIFGTILEGAKEALAPIGDLLKSIFGDDLFAGLGNGIAGVIEFFDRLTTAIAENGDGLKQLGAFIVGVIAVVKVIYPLLVTVFVIGEKLWGIIQLVGAVIGALNAPVLAAIAAIAALVAIGVLLYKNWDTISAKLAELWEAFKDLWSRIFDATSEHVGQIVDTVTTKFNEMIAFITSLPSQAYQWGADIINSMVNGIKETIGGIAEGASEIAGKIKSFIHFSEPDEGPLADFHTYMPDMIDQMAEGIRGGTGVIGGALEELTGFISDGLSSISGGAIDIRSSGKAESTDRAIGIKSSEHANSEGWTELSAGLKDAENAMRESGVIAKAGFLDNLNVLRQIASYGMSAVERLAAIKSITAPQLSTVSNVTNGGSKNRTVNMNVNMQNTFNGDKAIQQNASNTMNKASRDMTAELARGLAYT